MAKQELSFGGTEGCVITGLGRPVILPAAATRTLKASESGALVMLDTATQTITLPVPVAGMYFEFYCSTTSTAQKVITDSTATFLLGTIFAYTVATASGAGFAANGTTHRAIATNGTTTGGIVGDCYRVTAINGTQWVISGTTTGSGTIVTPFATS